jgi:hypothetical protein
MESVPSVGEIVNAANEIFNVMMPVMPLVVIVGVLMHLFNRVIGKLEGSDYGSSFGSDSSLDPVPSDDPPKPKRGAMFIPTEDEYVPVPEKPKRQIVRVGDDGELLYDEESRP